MPAIIFYNTHTLTAIEKWKWQNEHKLEINTAERLKLQANREDEKKIIQISTIKINIYIHKWISMEEKCEKKRRRKRIVNRHWQTVKRLKSIRKSAEKTNHFNDSIALILIKMTMKKKSENDDDDDQFLCGERKRKWRTDGKKRHSTIATQTFETHTYSHAHVETDTRCAMLTFNQIRSGIKGKKCIGKSVEKNQRHKKPNRFSSIRALTVFTFAHCLNEDVSFVNLVNATIHFFFFVSVIFS